MKVYERLSFRAKLILQAMLAATTALVLAIVALGYYYLLDAQQQAENELRNYAELIAPSRNLPSRSMTPRPRARASPFWPTTHRYWGPSSSPRTARYLPGTFGAARW